MSGGYNGTAMCDRCKRTDLPVRPGHVILPVAHVAMMDGYPEACLDGDSGMPWYRPYGGSTHMRHAEAYQGQPGNYDQTSYHWALNAEWDL